MTHDVGMVRLSLGVLRNMLDPKELRRRFVLKMRQFEDADKRMTYGQVAKLSGKSKATIDNLARGIPKAYKADTLIAIAHALGEGPDFFFRAEAEPPPSERREICALDKEAFARDLAEHVYQKSGCDTFVIVATCPESGDTDVIRVKDGRVEWCGADQRRVARAMPESERRKERGQ